MVKRITTALGLLSLVALLPNAVTAQPLNGNHVVKSSVAKAKKNGGSHSKLTNILHSAGFSTALSGGAYTIFAPTDNAFAKLPQNRLSDLLRPENRSQLKAIMARHVLAGNIGLNELRRAIEEGNGAAKFRTLGGDSLVFRRSGDRVIVSDSRGHVSTVNASNMRQGNSTIYAVDTILM
jgi:uncharacterized surface protein with fasciclin (FAS1) repeats